MLTVVVQAGGESRRMGRDKGLVPFLGKPLITRVVQRVSKIADEIIVTTNRPDDYKFLNLPLAADIIIGRGALGGIYTALSYATHPIVIIVACDMPFINPALLAVQRDILIAQQADLVVPHTGTGIEPLHAAYKRDTCLPFVKTAIDASNWRVDSWFHDANVYFLPKERIQEIDPLFLSFSNVNTMSELQSAEKLAVELELV